MNLYPYILHEVSVLIEFIFGHLRYLVTDVPPQPNSPSIFFIRLFPLRLMFLNKYKSISTFNEMSEIVFLVVVFHV